MGNLVGSDNLDLLLARLTWPSPLVRERTAAAIADLLVSQDWSAQTRERLLEWIAAQPLESLALVGLLPFWRAAKQSEHFEIPPTERLVSAVRRPSLLSRMLLAEMGRPDPSSPGWRALCSGAAPPSFAPGELFTKYHQAFLAPWHSKRAEEVERRSGARFTHQWAFESAVTLNSLGRKESTEALNFRGRPDGEHYGIFDTFLSDVYRSAYLRAIAWTLSTARISYEDAHRLAAEVCPVDLALWHVASGEPPTWWPRSMKPSGQVDTVPAEIWRALASLWEEQQAGSTEDVIVLALGRVHEGKTTYDLDVYGIFHKVLGPSEPEIQDLVSWCEERHLPTALANDLRFVGDLGWLEPSRVAKGFGEWTVVPAAGWVRPIPLAEWQVERSMLEVHLPMPYLVGPAAPFRCGSRSVEVLYGNNVVAEWADWVQRVRETDVANLPSGTGRYLTIKRGLVDSFQQRTKSAFCWVCRLTGYHREHSYEPYKTFEQHRLFGARRIILPP